MYDLVGKTLGKYRIIELLNQTAATDVYKGFHPGMNRYVVVNVLKPALSENQALLQRFQNQNDIAAKIQHPNLLPLIDFGEENGIYYRVLVYGTEGGWSDNKQWFNNNPAIIKLFSQLTAGLSHVHSFGNVHMNLRPDNIFFGAGRTAMLGDFAIAAFPDSARSDPFSSPEVSRREPVDHRADIYALGVLLYELLTGSPPDLERYVSLRVQRPDLPDEVEMVIIKALSDNPEDRFQSATTFQSALEAAFRYTAITAPVAPIPVVVQQPPKSKGWLVVLIIFLVVLCIGTLVFVIPRLNGEDAVETPSAPDGEVAVVPTQPPAPVVPTEPAPVAPTAPAPVVPTQPAPDEDRPGLQWPDIDWPDLSEIDIPICNSIFPAAGLGMVGIIAGKARRKNKAKDDEYQVLILSGKDNDIEE
jgi:serine/threonine protein kinase